MYLRCMRTNQKMFWENGVEVWRGVADATSSQTQPLARVSDGFGRLAFNMSVRRSG